MIPKKEWSTMRKLMILGKMAVPPAVEDTATGNPLTFLTDLAKPLKSLLIPFTPQQEGSRDPSPQNIRSILPWNGLTVFGGGKNLFDASAVIRKDGYLLNDNGVEQSTTQSGYTLNRTKVKSGGTYTFSGTIVQGAESFRLYFYNGDTFVSRTAMLNDHDHMPYTFTVPENCDGIAFQYNKITVDFSTFQLEVGQTATAYEPYKPITETDIVFPSPVYGGTLDVVSGVLTVEWARVKISELDWQYQNNWNGRFRAGLAGKDGVDASVAANLMCDCYKSELGTNSNNNIICGYGKGNSGLVYIKDSRFTDKDDFVEAVGDYYIYYPLLTPQEIQLTPAQITALIGNNTIWSDADGQMTAVYLKKG